MARQLDRWRPSTIAGFLGWLEALTSFVGSVADNEKTLRQLNAASGHTPRASQPPGKELHDW